MEEKEFISVNKAIELTSLSRTSIFLLRKNNLIKWYEVSFDQSKKKSRKPKVLILKSSLLDYIESKEISG